MAYDRTKLLHIGGVSPLPQVWQYFSSDTVTSAGYIPKDEGVNAGDRVEVIDITYSAAGLITAYANTQYYAKADANGVLTLEALDADPATIKSDLADLGEQVSEIEAKIPDTATDENQLADKAFVAANYAPIA